MHHNKPIRNPIAFKGACMQVSFHQRITILSFYHSFSSVAVYSSRSHIRKPTSRWLPTTSTTRATHVTEHTSDWPLFYDIIVNRHPKGHLIPTTKASYVRLWHQVDSPPIVSHKHRSSVANNVSDRVSCHAICILQLHLHFTTSLCIYIFSSSLE